MTTITAKTNPSESYENTVYDNAERRPVHPVLIVEDTPESQELLSQLCDEINVKHDVAANGAEALAAMARKTYSVYIVDLMMPEMDGPTFIPLLKKKDPQSVIIVQTAVSSSDTIIEIMRMGVFDYIIKPIDPDLFFPVIEKALEFKYLKDMETLTQIQSAKKVRQEMDWLIYKENRSQTDKDKADKKSVYNLKTSVSQGGGFGTILTLLELLEKQKVEYNDHYLVNKELVNLLVSNKSIISTHIFGLQSASDILENELPMQNASGLDLIAKIPEFIQDIMPYLRQKKIRLTFPRMTNDYILYLHWPSIKLVIEELFINACKYTPTQTTVDILTYVNKGYFCLAVKNDVAPEGVITPEQESLVKEAFYRILPPVEELAPVEKFSLGLGLAIVETVMKKHNGLFSIRSMKDHVQQEKKDTIVAELMFPYESV